MKYICLGDARADARRYLIAYHPVGFAAWVGLLITSINLMPIGQLDGGHILYGMFRKKAHVASIVVLVLAITASIALKIASIGG